MGVEHKDNVCSDARAEGSARERAKHSSMPALVRNSPDPHPRENTAPGVSGVGMTSAAWRRSLLRRQSSRGLPLAASRCARGMHTST